MKKILYLIDGSCYIFRYYFGIPMMYNHEGMPINILYGYCHMLRKLLDDENNTKLHTLLTQLQTQSNPDYVPEITPNYQKYITIAFDSGSKESFRREIYSEYKANRVQAPSELRIQCQHLHKICQTFNIKNLSIPGFEADDIIASYTQLAIQNNFDHVIILSCDKDMMQLVSDHVFIYDTFKNTLYDPVMVYQKFHVHPYQITDYLTLVGDSSDNIPGVPGIGPKTASRLLKEFDNIENIFNNLDLVKPTRHQQTLNKHQDNIDRARQLTQLNMDITLPNGLDTLCMQPLNIEKVIDLCAYYNIKLKH